MNQPRNSKGRPSGLPTFLAALTSTDQLSNADRIDAGRVQFQAFSGARWRATAAYHRAMAAQYDEYPGGITAGNLNEDGLRCTMERERLCRLLFVEMDRFFAIASRTKDDCRAKAVDLAKWRHAFSGLLEPVKILRAREPEWKATISAEAERLGVKIKMEA